MSLYAIATRVPIERSRAEMERTLGRYGADSFAYATNKRRAMVTFKAHGRVIRFVLELPEFERFRATPRGRRRRSDQDAYRHWEQACRQSWRALALVIKAKLEAVESGIAVFETEFLPYTVLPNGKTVGDWALPQVAHAYETGKMPALLPGHEEG